MFGLRRPSHKPLPKSSRSTEAGSDTLLPKHIQLVAREDVFSKAGEKNPVLLIREGQVVGEELLSKLIRYGADPKQFVFKPLEHPAYSDEVMDSKAQESSEALLNQSAMTGLTEESTRKSVAQNKIVIYEPNPRSLKRMVDTLVLSGVHLGDIHPVTALEKLDEVLTKQKPTILFVDPSFHVESSIFAKLKELKHKYHIEDVLLMPSISKQHEDERELLLEKAEQANVNVIFKPVNSFALTPFLNAYKTRRSIQQSIMKRNHSTSSY